MQILKKVYNWIYKTMPPRENPIAIRNWQTWLNTYFPPGPWLPINGFNTMVQMSPSSNTAMNINTNGGYPLKGFVNTSTGEVKVFDARKFYA